MIKFFSAAAVAVCFFAAPGWAATAEPSRIDESQIEEQRLLGSANEQAQQAGYLPFSRRLNVTGVVAGSLQDSAKAAGVPAVATLEIVRAFGATIDLDEDLINGDSFSVSYRQEYTVEGHPIGVPQVMWVELRTATRGTLSAHRFRASRSKQENLWFATGEAAGPASLRWPVDEIVISSNFGLRSNPMLKKAPVRKPAPTGKQAPAGKTMVAQVARKNATAGPAGGGGVGRFSLLMHHGVDFAAEMGTPIYAAAAGTVTGARPNGGYGNWVEIRHEGEFQTVYGHMSAFAPGIVEGIWVERGQLIGFVGSTGRSTGPHLHFELQQNRVATNPIVHPIIRQQQMRDGDLARFQRVVARNLEEARP